MPRVGGPQRATLAPAGDAGICVNPDNGGVKHLDIVAVGPAVAAFAQRQVDLIGGDGGDLYGGPFRPGCAVSCRRVGRIARGCRGGGVPGKLGDDGAQGAFVGFGAGVDQGVGVAQIHRQGGKGHEGAAGQILCRQHALGQGDAQTLARHVDG